MFLLEQKYEINKIGRNDRQSRSADYPQTERDMTKLSTAARKYLIRVNMVATV